MKKIIINSFARFKSKFKSLISKFNSLSNFDKFIIAMLALNVMFYLLIKVKLAAMESLVIMLALI